MNTDTMNRGAAALPLQRALAEPFAFALLQWPLLLAGLAADGSGLWLVLRIACGGLPALALLAAYTRGPGFGNALLAAAGCVAGAWWAWPTAWAVAWLVLLGLLMLAAQQLRLRRAEPVVPVPVPVPVPVQGERAGP